MTRAQVQLANEHQRLLVAQNERTSARLQLLKVIGLRLTTSLRLTDRLDYAAASPPTPATTRGSGKPAWRSSSPKAVTGANAALHNASRLPSSGS